MGSTFVFCCVLFAFALGPVTGQNLFSDDGGIEGQSIVMTCDLRRSGYAGSLVTDVYGVSSLQVTKFQNNQDEVLVNYRSPPPGSTVNPTFVDQQRLPEGLYKVVTEGLYPTAGNIEGNQNGMKIEITFENLICADQGIYKCKSLYYSSDQVFQAEERPENLNIDALPQWNTNDSNNLLDADPYEPDFEYAENANLTFRCRAWGSSNMTIKWFYQLCPNDTRNSSSGPQTPKTERWYPDEDIQENKTNIDSSDKCWGLELESRLGQDVDGARIQMNKIGRRGDGLLCFLQCQVGVLEGNLFRPLLQRNQTFQYTRSDPSTNSTTVENPAPTTVANPEGSHGEMVRMSTPLLMLMAAWQLLKNWPTVTGL